MIYKLRLFSKRNNNFYHLKINYFCHTSYPNNNITNRETMCDMCAMCDMRDVRGSIFTCLTVFFIISLDTFVTF